MAHVVLTFISLPVRIERIATEKVQTGPRSVRTHSRFTLPNSGAHMRMTSWLSWVNSTSFTLMP